MLLLFTKWKNNNMKSIISLLLVVYAALQLWRQHVAFTEFNEHASETDDTARYQAHVEGVAFGE